MLTTGNYYFKVLTTGNFKVLTTRLTTLQNGSIGTSNSYFKMLATLNIKAAMTSAKDSAPASGPLTTLSVGLSLSSSC